MSPFSQGRQRTRPNFLGVGSLLKQNSSASAKSLPIKATEFTYVNGFGVQMPKPHRFTHAACTKREKTIRFWYVNESRSIIRFYLAKTDYTPVSVQNSNLSFSGFSITPRIPLSKAAIKKVLQVEFECHLSRVPENRALLIFYF